MFRCSLCIYLYHSYACIAVLEVPIYSQKKQEYLPMSILSPYEVYQDFISTPDSALEQAFNCLTPLNPTERTKILDQHWVSLT